MVLEFDVAFIQPPEQRANDAPSTTVDIPIIDLANGGDGLSAEIAAACREWGFFQVINHGISYDLVARTEEAARAFFALPVDVKRSARRDEVNPLGFYEAEHTKNVRDWKEVFDFVVEEPAFIPFTDDPDDVCSGEQLELIELWNRWPSHCLEFREVCEEYGKAVTALAFKLLELIAVTMELPAKCLNKYFDENTSFVRLNYYPPCPSPDLALGVGRHKDSGALTVLYQDDVGGLEVKRQSDGQWIRVKPIEDSLIINIGDIIQVWSNDKYQSAEHRVTANSNRERLSIPFFFNPAHYVRVQPLEELINEDAEARYKEYNWGQFFSKRKISDYKKLEVDNVQVAHFKLSE